MKKVIAYLLAVLFLTSCFEKEEPIQPFPRGDVQDLSMEMGPKYSHQIFYSFAQNAVVKSVERDAWDLAFSCEQGNSSIYLNTGNGGYAAFANSNDLSQVTDTVGLQFQWDWSNGRDDSTALAGWDTTDRVIVVDLGTDLDDQHRGFAKMKVEVDGDDFVLSYALIEETTFTQERISKNTTHHRVYYSLVNQTLVDVAPPKDLYDLVFRKYIYYFDEEEIPYNVVGGLIKSRDTRILYIDDIDFLDIQLADTVDYEWTTSRDEVGYDWKWFNLNQGFYEVFPEKCWIIQTADGFYYKFHFTDFYNTSGDRGYPKIEFKLL